MHLLSLAKTTRQLLTMKLADIDVLAGQDQLLSALDANKPGNIVHLADMLSVRASTVSKMLDIFEKKGWAVREAGPIDKRKVFARLTPLGEHRQGMVREVWAKLESELAAHLDNGTIEAILTSLHQIDGVLTRRLARLR